MPSWDQILTQLAEPFTGELLFDQLPDIVFFMKNVQGQYVVVNATLAERCGLRDKMQLLGKTSADVYRSPFGETYVAQDLQVIQTGKPLLNQLELHIYPSWDVGWCLTTKLPLRDREGVIVGLVGVSQDLRLPDASQADYQNIATAIKWVSARLETRSSVTDMAKFAKLSRYQLDRRMRQIFGLTTGQWLLKIRIDAARRRLRETGDAIATIAHDCGYADQSAFTRHFRETTGVTPTQYRQAK
ncbi:helix-turn-helix domain-containing protein [bacterium]|nr:helix-turn-helix domain-containing protein [bacterium]